LDAPLRQIPQIDPNEQRIDSLVQGVAWQPLLFSAEWWVRNFTQDVWVEPPPVSLGQNLVAELSHQERTRGEHLPRYLHFSS
jgi:hypothetical protein